jgi:hypothetical protein
MGLSAVFPILHGVEIYGVQEMRGRIGLTWMVLQGFLYILGAGLYAVSFDPNKIGWKMLTIAGSLARTIFSRVLRYLGKLSPDIPHTCCDGGCVASVRSADSFRLSSLHAWPQVLTIVRILLDLVVQRALLWLV